MFGSPCRRPVVRADRRCRFEITVHLELGDRRFDITTNAVVVGILNRTPDSFFDQGTYFGFDEFLRKAEHLVADGADVLDVGGVKAGPGPEVDEQEELDRVIPAITALHERFDTPLCVVRRGWSSWP